MIEFLHFGQKDRNIEEYHQRRIDRNNQILFSHLFDAAFWSQMQPYSIEIETVNRCNNDCSFCPVNRNHDTRPYCKMSETLFDRILEQLHQMDYHGYLSLFSNNEPLLDNRLLTFLAKARQQVPHAKLCLFTNGTLLTEKKFEALIGLLDYLTIDNYSDDLQLLPSVKRSIQPYMDRTFPCRVRVFIRRKTQILSSRGGEAPNRGPLPAYEGPCMMPFMQIVIRPDGKISKCCQDGLGLSCVGDLTRQTLMECWQDPRRRALWKALSCEGRRCIPSCCSCDVFGHDNYMPDSWKPTIIQNFVRCVADQYRKNKTIILAGAAAPCKKIEHLLTESGIRISEVLEDTAPIEYDPNAFYILETYAEPFLEQIDPKAQYVGEKWIVFEHIPKYIIHDTSRQIFGFAEVLSRLFDNWGATFCYWGDDATFAYLNTYLRLPAVTRITDIGQLCEIQHQVGQRLLLLLAAQEENRKEELIGKRILDADQILLFNEWKSYTDSL